jgi:DNA polymerase III delta prime subunit
VNSKPLFHTGMKFVILDEVDYMTKTAQQALRYLLQNYTSSVRFCLICNYISKIDEGLQNEFMRLRFNQLPKEKIFSFLTNISQKENLCLSKETIANIQELFNSDIRSMINFMQTNQDIVLPSTNKETEPIESDCKIIGKNVWDEMLQKIQKNESVEKIYLFIHDISKNYNMDKKNIIKCFFNFIIRNQSIPISSDFLLLVENCVHSQNSNTLIYVNYAVSSLSSLIRHV